MQKTIIAITTCAILGACQLAPSVTLLGSNKAGNVRVSTTLAGPILGK